MQRRTHRVIVSAVLAAALAAPLFCEARPTIAPSGVEQRAEALYQKLKLPGFAVAVARGGEIVASESLGRRQSLEALHHRGGGPPRETGSPRDFQVILSKFLANPPTWTSVEESLSIFMDDPLVFEPGTAYAYSSYGYNVVSAVVEGASDEPFLDYMEAKVFTPLGLHAARPSRDDCSYTPSSSLT